MDIDTMKASLFYRT